MKEMPRKHRLFDLVENYLRAVASEKPDTEMAQLRRVIRHEEALIEAGEVRL